MAEASPSDPRERFWIEWHRIVAEKDVAALTDVLAEDVTLGAPPYWDKLSGRGLVVHLLGLIVNTIEGFTYQREWRDGAELALEFTGRVGELHVQGIDLISLDEQGRVSNIDVLMRPLNTLEVLRDIITPQMLAFLSEKSD